MTKCDTGERGQNLIFERLTFGMDPYMTSSIEVDTVTNIVVKIPQKNFENTCKNYNHLFCRFP